MEVSTASALPEDLGSLPNIWRLTTVCKVTAVPGDPKEVLLNLLWPPTMNMVHTHTLKTYELSQFKTIKINKHTLLFFFLFPVGNTELQAS